MKRKRLLALALVCVTFVPGCRAYDSRYWSFPLNSMQMVENASHWSWSFGRALAAELAFQVFPWSMVESAVDLALLPVTSLHDVFAFATEKPGDGFEAQVREARRHPHDEPRLTPAEAAQRAGRDIQVAPTER